MSAWVVFFDRPVEYGEAATLQDHLAAMRAREEIPDVVLFLEHPPVVTLGARGRSEHLRLTRKELAARGIALYSSSRGGDVTYHAPGQIVLYPILRLGQREADAHGYLANLEEVAIRTAADFGVRAWRRPGLNGAWTSEGKLAAIGFRLRRWVTLHGMSFNVDLDLLGFETIVPCGLHEPVTSLRHLLGARGPSVVEVREQMAVRFQEVFQRRLERQPVELVWPVGSSVRAVGPKKTPP